MKGSWVAGVLAGMGIVAVMFALSGRLDAQGGPAATGRVATIDVQLIMNEYEGWKALADEVDQARTRLNQEQANRQKSIEAMGTTIEAMGHDDPAYVKRMADYYEAIVALKTWQQVMQSALEREFTVATDRLYRDLLSQTRNLAEAAGYDIVLDSMPYRQMADPQAIQEQIADRKVVYSNQAVDISQLVLDKLNGVWRGRTPTPLLQLPAF